MLFIKHTTGKEDVLYINTFDQMKNISVTTVLSVTADGHEALELFYKFLNPANNQPTIPWNYYTNFNLQTWFGDMAKTILSSLI